MSARASSLKRLSLTGAALMAASAWFVVPAFSCSAQPRFYAITPAAAAPGETVKVEGHGVVPGTAVEIRWNGVNGEVVGQTKSDGQAQFSASVVVPPVAPGIYALVSHIPGQYMARISFEVTGSGAASAAPASSAPNPESLVSSDAWRGFKAQGASPALRAPGGLGSTQAGAVAGVLAGTILLGVSFALVARRARQRIR